MTNTPTERLEPGYYLATKMGCRPGVVEYATCNGLIYHWRNANDDRMEDPRTLGYTIHSVAGLLDLQRKCELLCQQNGNLLFALSRLVRAKDEKDANGETELYRTLKDGAWENARRVLTPQGEEGEG